MNDLTPQSMRSPVSPYDQQSKQSFTAQRPCFPASPQPEPTSMEQPARGLGIFECPPPQAQSTVHELPPSPQPSDSWSHSSMMEPQEYPPASQQPPDLSTAAFDPFSNYFNNNPNSGMMTSSSPEAPPLVFCQTPPSTNMPSHRNSVSSACSPSDSYSQHGSEYYTPKVKMEGPEWYTSPGNDDVRRLTTHGLSTYSNGVSPINGPGEDHYKSVTADWAKPIQAALPVDFSHMTGDESRPHFDNAHILPSVNRIKKKRQRTTPEEATHECRVCGKLFKRSYNWKSHMETHNPDRKYPHPCTAVVGGQPCTKKFQRKTDLDRHYDSVHLKARNHQCNLCGNRFARRDTLRRHTEDGCPKRFELGFRDSSATTPARWPLPNFTAPKRSFSLGTPMSQSMSGGPSPAPFPNLDRTSFVSSPIQAPAIYAS